MSARERALGLLDPGSFAVIGEAGEASPLLTVGGLIAGVPVTLALLDGHKHGGTIGLDEATRFVEAAEAMSAAAAASRVLILGFDTGGVRVEEGPRALAAASAAGVALARLSVQGIPLVSIISGPRGCFGAPAVMAALPELVIMTGDANWGMTGPRLFGGEAGAPLADEAKAATSAASRLRNGDAHVIVDDSAVTIRRRLSEFVDRLTQPRPHRSPKEYIVASALATTAMRSRLREYHLQRQEPVVSPSRRKPRDMLRYSFRGLWDPSGTVQRAGLIHAALGTLGGQRALGLVIGSEASATKGIGIEEAAVVTDMLRLAVTESSERAAVLTFLFCQGHAFDVDQERFGLHRALAECLRAHTAARVLGYPSVAVLGGGTYGAAYLALAAPSHRILAMRGTSIAPMAPQVLRAFQSLRGAKSGHEAGNQLAELIPEIRIVESVIRLPRVLREELEGLLRTVQADNAAA